MFRWVNINLKGDLLELLNLKMYPEFFWCLKIPYEISQYTTKNLRVIKKNLQKILFCMQIFILQQFQPFETYLKFCFSCCWLWKQPPSMELTLFGEGAYLPTSSNQTTSTRRVQLSIAAKAVRPTHLLNHVKTWFNTD